MPPASSTTNDLIVHGGTLIDGTGADPVPRAAVAVRDGRVVYAGPAAGLPSGLRGEIPELDAEGRWIIPGLIDAHTHVCFNGREPVEEQLPRGTAYLALEAARTAARMLWCGITAARDVGGWAGIDVAIRDAVRRGLIAGPFLQVAGQLICQTGGHAHFIGVEADGPDAVRRAARLQLKAGADLIKIMATGGAATRGQNVEASQLSVEELRAAADVAHAAMKRIAAHAHGNRGIRNCIEAGIDTIEHASILDEETAALMAARERPCYMVPTFEYGPHHGAPVGGSWDAEFLERSAALERRMRESFRLARAAGVRIALGSDCGGNPFAPHDFSVQGQIERAVEYGMTPMEALCAATRMGAEVMGLEQERGTLQPGRRADLLVVEGDPLADPSATRRIAAIVQDGRLVDRERLALLAGLA